MKRLISFILCLVMTFSVIPVEAIATYLPEQENDVITPIGDFDGVPILSEDDAIKLADEYTGPETEEEFVDLLLSDSEEAKVYFNESEDEEKEYIGAEFWDNLPQYKMVDGEGNEIGPGQSYDQYHIPMENGEYYQVFRYRSDDSGRWKMYYLYVLWKRGIIESVDGVQSNDSKVSKYKSTGSKSYQFVWFYTTLPYSSYGIANNAQGWTAHCSEKPGTQTGKKFTPKPGASEYGMLPIPKSVADTRTMRSYSFSEMKNGGSKVITDISGVSHTVNFDGMEELWVSQKIGSGDAAKWENTYSYYANPQAFLYPTTGSDGNKNTNLKNATSISPFDYSSGMTVPEGFSKINPKKGTVRLATEWDSGAFLKSDNGKLMTSRQNIAGMIQDKIAISTAGGFVDDTNFPKGWQGFYSPDLIDWMPWWNTSHGELGRPSSSTPKAKYRGTLNEKWIKNAGSRQKATNSLNSNIIRMDAGGMLYKLHQAGALKVLKLTPDEKTDIAAGYDWKLAQEIKSIYGDKYSLDEMVSEDTKYFLYLDPNIADKVLSEEIKGYTGLVYGMQTVYGSHGVTEEYPHDRYVYTNTGESLETMNNGSLYDLYVNKGNHLKTDLMHMTLTIPGDWKLETTEGEELNGGTFGFFPCVYFLDVRNFSSLQNWSAEKREALVQTNTFGKLLYILLYLSIDNNMTDPTKPIMDDGKYPVTSNFAATRSKSGNYYRTGSLFRNFEKTSTPPTGYPLPTVTKDLVVADTEENPIYEELEGKYEKEYMGSNLWCINEKVSDKQFQEIVGTSKEGFNNIATTNSGSEEGIEALKLKKEHNYQGLANIKNLGKDDFLKCFRPVDPTTEYLKQNTTYIIQTNTYMKADVSDYDGEMTDLALFTTNKNVGMAMNFTKGSLTEGQELKNKENITMLNSYFWDWRALMPAALNDTNNGYKNLSFANGFLSYLNVSDNEIAKELYKKTVVDGENFSPMLYKQKKTADKEFSPYTLYKPWGNWVAENDMGEQIATGYSEEQEGYTNTSSVMDNGALVADSENKANNVKIFRAFYHVSEDNSVKEGDFAEIRLFLYDTDAVHRYSEDKGNETNVYNEIPTANGTQYLDQYWALSRGILAMARKAGEAIATKLESGAATISDGEPDDSDEKGTAEQIRKAINDSNEILTNVTKTAEIAGQKFEAAKNILKWIPTDLLKLEWGDFNPTWIASAENLYKDNTVNTNDGIILRYYLSPPATNEQRNLSVYNVTVYQSTDGGKTWSDYSTARYTRDEIREKSTQAEDGKWVFEQDLGTLNLNYVYQVCMSEQFSSFYSNPLDEEASHYNVSKDNTLYMYGGIESLGVNYTDKYKILPDYEYGEAYGGSKGADFDKHNPHPWGDATVESKIGNTDVTRSSSTKAKEETIANWTPSYINNDDYAGQLLPGKYYSKLIAEGKGTKDKDGNAYIEDAYIFGIHPDWSTNEDDSKNDNTTLPLPGGERDVERVRLTYRFANSADFDNAITEVFVVDKNGDRIDLSKSCDEPAKLKDIDLGTNGEYFLDTEPNFVPDIADHTYVLVVKVERKETASPHEDVGVNCRLKFVGDLLGETYYESDPLYLLLLNDGSIVNRNGKTSVSQLTNCSYTMKKDGDYIYYYIKKLPVRNEKGELEYVDFSAHAPGGKLEYDENGDLKPNGDTRICGTFTFYHQDPNTPDGYSTNDKVPENNRTVGAADWGPFDFIIENLTLNPDRMYFTAEKPYWPTEDNSDKAVEFSVDVKAIYQDGNGNTPVIINESFFPHVTLTLEEMNTNDKIPYWKEVGLVSFYPKTTVHINGGTVRIQGLCKLGRIYQEKNCDMSGVYYEGRVIRYNLESKSYRLVARVNGGNAITPGSSVHEQKQYQTVKLETNHENNKVTTPITKIGVTPEDCLPCKDGVQRNDWNVTFYWTECPTPEYYTYSCGSAESPRTCTGCRGVNCRSWEGSYSFYETYDVEIQVCVNKAKNIEEAKKLPDSAWINAENAPEIRAGETFSLRVKSTYYTNRGNLPKPDPYGGCAYRRRSPGYSCPFAYRFIKLQWHNQAGNQSEAKLESVSGWEGKSNYITHTVPKDAANFDIDLYAETAEFYGYREEGNLPLSDSVGVDTLNNCLCSRAPVKLKIRNPLPVTQGNQVIW